jgi:hypothetical protein
MEPSNLKDSAPAGYSLWGLMLDAICWSSAACGFPEVAASHADSPEGV